MCDVVGVDALASQKGFWSEMFGVGDFYYKLGVSIVDVCLSTRGKNGGIMPIEYLLARVEERSGCVDPPHTSLVNSDFVCECCSILARARGFLLEMEHMPQQATCVIFLYLLSRSSLTWGHFVLSRDAPTHSCVYKRLLRQAHLSVLNVPQYTTKHPHTHPRPVAYTRGLNTALLTFTFKIAYAHARDVRYGKHKDLEGISIDDLERAIKKLGSLGRGFEIIEVRCVVCLDV
jgi:hypothetical protein